ncbi:hypothetical protein [Leucobacter sp. wl10]|uniref:hypothetical protein n=1 Tax=Leucobacter sp. wl10 TaxID=2304677 RepID=UPI000E5B92E4|nr:hypothetical protein [Leucobacter sp. wl10]RGE17628.1 hypothetical protein D1J51_15550 [Leucobacter sp. wl10]
MSKDPLEELFGPSADEPRPVPARQRLAQEQAERVRTAQLPAGKRGPQTREHPRVSERAARARPWIVVGVIAVLAIVASIIVVNAARGGREDAGSTTDPAGQSNGTSAQPTQTGDPGATDGKGTEADKVPEVEVGETSTLPITQWGVSGQLSTKFGMTQYTLQNGNAELWLDSPLISQFPCEGNWGAVQTAAGQYEVLKPAERCAAAPELYDELWGLTDAFVQTIK